MNIVKLITQHLNVLENVKLLGALCFHIEKLLFVCSKEGTQLFIVEFVQGHMSVRQCNVIKSVNKPLTLRRCVSSKCFGAH